MRLLFTMDKKDYDPNAPRFIRPSARAIIRNGNQIAMVRSKKYNYYKFPGGGMEAGETEKMTLIREVREEAGLIVIPESMEPYGYVRRIQKGKQKNIFVQDNYYYFCNVEHEQMAQQLDPYEEEEQFSLEYVCPEHAIQTNQSVRHGAYAEDVFLLAMAEREAGVLELLLKERMCGTAWMKEEKIEK